MRNCNFRSMLSSETMDTTSEYTQDNANSIAVGGDEPSILTVTSAPGVLPGQGDPKLGGMGTTLAYLRVTGPWTTGTSLHWITSSMERP